MIYTCTILVLQVIAQHEQRCLSPTIVHPPIPPLLLSSETQGNGFPLPEIIIWDPLRQFPTIFQCMKNIICPEEQCKQPMTFLTWQHGSKQRYNLKCLYGVRGLVVLVCQIYYCPRGHFMATSDPRFLANFPERNCIPFVLLHRSGVTRELMRTIFNMATLGSTFSEIEAFLLWTVQQEHAKDGILLWNSYCGKLPSSNLCFPTAPSNFMSKDLITDIFMVAFQEMKDFLLATMSSLTAEYCSCDYTFKMAKHIGIMRNGKWVPQYDSLFILQNERGDLLFWQLTMGTAYAFIHDAMESLKSRAEHSSKGLKMIIIDNCCMWRRLLQDMFGEHLLVKLDVFHGVQRVSRVLSKKHPYFYNFLQDFRLVFRSKGDSGPQRMKPTPGPEILQANLDFFKEVGWNSF